MKRWPSCILLLLSFAAWGQAPAQSVSKTAPTEEIRAVVETFRLSIINKDKESFLKLFYGDKVPWISVADGETRQLAQRVLSDRPASPRAYETDTYRTFIDFVVGDTFPIEEKFSNIKIDTDDNVATVFFDYSFHINNIKTNWGKETWHLVHTDAGWKINSVIYSVVTDPPKSRKESEVPAATLADYAGTYEIRPGTNLVILVDGKHLNVEMGQRKIRLYPESQSKFFDRVWGSTIEFMRDEKGAVTHAVQDDGLSKTKAVRK